MELIKRVKTYRLTPALDQRERLAGEIFREIKQPLHEFILVRLKHPACDDVFQETVKAVVAGLTKFSGDDEAQFWKWCYSIARNKVADHLRRKGSDRLDALPPEELWQLVDESAVSQPLSADDRLDLEYAMKLLADAKPECREFLWLHFVWGLDYSELAEERQLSYDSVRMKIGRCLEQAQELMA